MQRPMLALQLEPIFSLFLKSPLPNKYMLFLLLVGLSPHVLPQQPLLLPVRFEEPISILPSQVDLYVPIVSQLCQIVSGHVVEETVEH